MSDEITGTPIIYELGVECHDIVDGKMCHDIVDFCSLTIE
jgi:hypothetical protein